jgi:4-hydroxybenzoate polyprenyltransferase
VVVLGYAAASGSARCWWAFLVCGLVWIATQTAYANVDKK